MLYFFGHEIEVSIRIAFHAIKILPQIYCRESVSRAVEHGATDIAPELELAYRKFDFRRRIDSSGNYGKYDNTIYI